MNPIMVLLRNMSTAFADVVRFDTHPSKRNPYYGGKRKSHKPSHKYRKFHFGNFRPMKPIA